MPPRWPTVRCRWWVPPHQRWRSGHERATAQMSARPRGPPRALKRRSVRGALPARASIGFDPPPHRLRRGRSARRTRRAPSPMHRGVRHRRAPWRGVTSTAFKAVVASPSPRRPTRAWAGARSARRTSALVRRRRGGGPRVGRASREAQGRDPDELSGDRARSRGLNDSGTCAGAPHRTRECTAAPFADVATSRRGRAGCRRPVAVRQSPRRPVGSGEAKTPQRHRLPVGCSAWPGRACGREGLGGVFLGRASTRRAHPQPHRATRRALDGAAGEPPVRPTRPLRRRPCAMEERADAGPRRRAPRTSHGDRRSESRRSRTNSSSTSTPQSRIDEASSPSQTASGTSPRSGRSGVDEDRARSRASR